MFYAVAPCLTIRDDVNYDNFLKVRRNQKCMAVLSAIAMIVSIAIMALSCWYNQTFTVTPIQGIASFSILILGGGFACLSLGYRWTNRDMFERMKQLDIVKETKEEREPNPNSSSHV